MPSMSDSHISCQAQRNFNRQANIFLDIHENHVPSMLANDVQSINIQTQIYNGLENIKAATMA